MNNNTGNNSNDEMDSLMNFGNRSFSAADLEVILNRDSRSRNNRSAVFLGYDESVSQQMCAFIDQLINHYTELVPALQDFREALDRGWEQLKENLLRAINAKNRNNNNNTFSNASAKKCRDIVQSHTFKAIIWNLINFYKLPRGVRRKINALDHFFSLVQTYFIDNLEELLKAHEGPDRYISRLKIIWEMQICSCRAWSRFDDSRERVSMDQMFSFFHEALFAISLGIILKKSCNTFVTQMPGVGDIITIFKRIPNHFWFIECKRQEDAAIRALRGLNEKKGSNLRNGQQGTSESPDLIAKLNPAIIPRFFATSFAGGSAAPKRHRTSCSLTPSGIVFAMRVLERFPLTAAQRPKNILDFNVLIDIDGHAEIDAFMRQECSSKVEIYTDWNSSVTFMQLATSRLDHKVNKESRSLSEGITLVNLNKGTRTKKSNRNFVTSEIAIEKLRASALSPLNGFNFSRGEAIMQVRRERFKGLKKNSHEKVRHLLAIGSALGFTQREIYDLIEISYNQNNTLKNVGLLEGFWHEPKSEPWIIVDAFPGNHVQGNSLKFLKIFKKPGFTIRFDPDSRRYRHYANPPNGYGLEFSPEHNSYIYKNFITEEIVMPTDIQEVEISTNQNENLEQQVNTIITQKLIALKNKLNTRKRESNSRFGAFAAANTASVPANRLSAISLSSNLQGLTVKPGFSKNLSNKTNRFPESSQGSEKKNSEKKKK